MHEIDEANVLEVSRILAQEGADLGESLPRRRYVPPGPKEFARSFGGSEPRLVARLEANHSQPTTWSHPFAALRYLD